MAHLHEVNAVYPQVHESEISETQDKFKLNPFNIYKFFNNEYTSELP